MEIKGVYNLTVSGIDGNGFQYISGMLEPPCIDKYGFPNGRAFCINIEHVKQKTTIMRNRWISGGPKEFEVIATLKDEIIDACEVESLLKKYNLL